MLYLHNYFLIKLQVRWLLAHTLLLSSRHLIVSSFLFYTQKNLQKKKKSIFSQTLGKLYDAASNQNVDIKSTT